MALNIRQRLHGNFGTVSFGYVITGDRFCLEPFINAFAIETTVVHLRRAPNLSPLLIKFESESIYANTEITLNSKLSMMRDFASLTEPYLTENESNFGSKNQL